MIKAKINSFKKGIKCHICTGCGRCFSNKPMHVVNRFSLDSAWQGKDASRELFLRDEEFSLSAPEYLIATDLGTTTIAMQLRRTVDGEVLGDYTALNPQRKYGADVLSRIAAAEVETAKSDMQVTVKEVLHQGVSRFLALLEEQYTVTDTKKQCGLVIAANPTMVHLLMGLAVDKMGQYPFEPETLAEMKIELFGLQTLILPGISAFVGGDIVAGIEVLSMHKKSEVTLLLDLGTNGEMVLGNRERLLATATAAGPAFEGIAEEYGTDLMAVIAYLRQEGIVDETGLLADAYFETGIDIGGVHISQQYIRQLQMAKAAIYTGITVLCKKYGIYRFSEIEKVFLAGGMGCYLDPQAAAAIGLFPQVLADKTVAVGNSALEGAFWYGRGFEWKQTEGHVVAARYKCETFNLAEEQDFGELYIGHMSLLSDDKKA